MKHIWFINEYDLLPEYSKYRRRYDMCKYLQRLKKYHLHIICGSFIHGSSNKYAFDSKKGRKINYGGIDVHILQGMSYNSNIKRILSMIMFFLRILFFRFPKEDKPDLFYISSPHLFGALAAVIRAKLMRCKIILEIRDLWPETWVQMKVIKEKGIIHKIFLFIEKYLYKNSDKIIFLADNFEYFINLGISKNKIVQISNGVDLEEFDKNIESRISFEENKFNVTYTGAIGYANNIEAIIELAKNTEEKSNIMFNIIGYGPLKEKYIEECKIKNIRNVRFYDPIPKKEVPNVLKQSKVLIMPILNIDLYKYGISPNKLYEYFASGRPILFYGKLNFDYIKMSKAGISVTTNRIIDLKNGLYELYKKSNRELEEIGYKGRKYVEENFSWKILSEKTDKIIDEVLNEGKNGK